jgi:hypothetical protein
VWQRDVSSFPVPLVDVQATRVIVATDGTLSVSGTVHTLSQATTGAGQASRPRISKSGGSTRRYAVVFERHFADQDPWALVIDSSGVPITPPIPLDSSVGNATSLQVDGNGTNWVASWQQAPTIFAEVWACSFAIAGSPPGLVATPYQVVEPVANFVASQSSSVIWTGGSALVVAERTPATLPDNIVVHSRDPFHCRPCEGRFTLAGGFFDSAPSGCSTASGGGLPDEALVVWTRFTASNGDIVGRFWRSIDGVTSSLGGGCGTGGTAQATCAMVPNPDFAHRLRGATPSAGTFLLQSLGQESASCGPCTRVPALAGGVALFLVTDALGNAAASSGIPHDIGLRGLVLFDQRFTLRTGGACSQFAVDMSNALRIVIE